MTMDKFRKCAKCGRLNIGTACVCDKEGDK